MTRQTPIPSVPRGEYVPDADHRVYMTGVDWDQFEAFLAVRGEKSSPRVTYLDGSLELMSPSRDHEIIRRILAAVVDDHLHHHMARWDGAGAWLLKARADRTGIEPDECYLIGDVSRARRTPDLAIEVVWTSGGIAKLDAYQRLGVREVWFWEDDVLTFFVLGESGYEEREQSDCLPAFDKQLAYDMLRLETLSDVLHALEARRRR